MAADRHVGPHLATVRARTTIAATLVVGFALSLGGVALVSVLRHSLVSDIDQIAELHAADLAERARQDRLASPVAGNDDEIVQILDRDHQVIAASSNALGQARIATLDPVSGRAATLTIRSIPGVPGEFRLVALRSATAGGPVTIYVAISLKPADATLLLVRTSLLIGAPLLLLLVAATTWATTGRALGPVDKIRSEVADISRRDLAQRVTVPTTKDEISRLATTMNEMLDRLQAAVEQQRRFVADASHELQTPIAASRVDLEVALTHPEAGDWIDTATRLLQDNHRMERLVADLLFIARADDDTPLAPPTPIDLHEVVLDEAARIGGSSPTTVDTTGVTSAFVAGRRDDLARAIRNLLDNALRYADSRITIELHTLDTTVTLSIQDDGRGVPAQHRERIFSRFTRVDDARSRHTGGTGLGLAIVKEIIERHHGTVTVQDGDPTGARFTIILPAD